MVFRSAGTRAASRRGISSSMSLNTLIQYATMLTLLVAICGVAVAVFSNQRQTNAAIYLDLSLRLQKLYQTVPGDLLAAHISGMSANPHEERMAGLLIDFLHLMDCGFTLHKAGFITGPLWKALNAEMVRGMRLPSFRANWTILRSQFLYSPDFLAYVDRAQLLEEQNGL
jgi:hypothetical protein